MGRVIIASLAVAASLAVPAAATAGGAKWSKPSTLVKAGTLIYQPAIATAGNGTTVIAWDQYDATKNKYNLTVAIRTPKGKVSEAKLGPAANTFAKPALAAGGDGTFAVAWEYPGATPDQSSLAVRVMAPGKKSFGATAKISGRNLSNDYGAGDFPSIAVDDSGTVFLGYVAHLGVRYQVVETQRAKGARAWSSPVRLSPGGTDSHGARIAADGKGAVAVSWAEADTSVWSATKSSAAARFGAAQKIAGLTYESSPPSLAISDKGKAAILWEQGGSNGSHRIASKVARFSFPSNAQYLSSAQAVSRYQALALASSGAGVAAWEQEVAGGWEIDGSALTASGTSWGKATRLTPTGYAATFGAAPVVAADKQRAVVAWSEKDIHHASFVGVTVRVGSRWSTPANFSGLSIPALAVPNDPGRSPVAGAMIWLSTAGLQISILKP